MGFAIRLHTGRVALQELPWTGSKRSGVAVKAAVSCSGSYDIPGLLDRQST